MLVSRSVELAVYSKLLHFHDSLEFVTIVLFPTGAEAVSAQDPVEAQIPRWFPLPSELTPTLADAKAMGTEDSRPRPLCQGMWAGSWKYIDIDTCLMGPGWLLCALDLT